MVGSDQTLTTLAIHVENAVWPPGSRLSSAASVLTALPIVAAVLVVQRRLVRGLTSGAVKG